MGPLFNRVVSETLEEETSNPVTMSAVKMEEVGVFSESVNRELEWNDSHLGCQWSRNGRHFAAGGGEGVLLVYDYDGDMMTSKLFSSYGCGNEILALDWSYPSASAPTELLLYGLQGGGLGIFNVMTSSVLREMTVDTASAIVDVAFSASNERICSSHSRCIRTNDTLGYGLWEDQFGSISSRNIDTN